MMVIRVLSCLIAGFLLSLGPALAGEKFITLASTTSTQNSGLFSALLPAFSKASGIQVRVVAVGTGAAIRLARNGDADVLLVHHKASEDRFVAQGYGTRRHPLMYNDFVLIGPASDPAAVKDATDIIHALERISRLRASFISRGDDSGTHKRERELWRLGNIDPTSGSGRWYREIGAGMGAALNMAAAQSAYVLSDRGTWLSFKNRQDLTIVHAGDARLRNVYGVIPVSQARHPHVKSKAVAIFIDWLFSKQGQSLIANYKINGQQLFHPIARAKQ